MKQVSDQSINEFLAQMQAICDQLYFSELSWENAKDAKKFFKYRDNIRVLQFLMALTPDYEPVCASMLHQGSLPTLESIMFELLSEETRLEILKAPPTSIPINTNTVLATSSSSIKSKKSCNYCRRPRHVISECKKLQYKNNKTQSNVPKGKPYHRQSHVVGVVTEESSPTFSLSNFERILKQLVASSSTLASAQFTIS